MADITLSLQGKVNLDDGYQQLFPLEITKTLIVLERQNKHLALGNNAIVLPRDSVPSVIVSYCLIIFNSQNPATVYTLKGVNGDTGIPLPLIPGWALIPVTGDFVISSSAADTLPTEFIFF